MEALLDTQLVRNNMTQTEIEHAEIISTGTNETLLIRVSYHGRYYNSEWIMLSYETGRHDIVAPYEISDRVNAHWDGFQTCVSNRITEIKAKRDAELFRQLQAISDNYGVTLTYLKDLI